MFKITCTKSRGTEWSTPILKVTGYSSERLSGVALGIASRWYVGIDAMRSSRKFVRRGKYLLLPCGFSGCGLLTSCRILTSKTGSGGLGVFCFLMKGLLIRRSVFSATFFICLSSQWPSRCGYHLSFAVEAFFPALRMPVPAFGSRGGPGGGLGGVGGFARGSLTGCPHCLQHMPPTMCGMTVAQRTQGVCLQPG